MKYTFEFDKTKYHLQDDIFKWCQEHISYHGSWVYYWEADEVWDEREYDWMASEHVFGRITITIRNEANALLFKMRWQ